MSGGFFYSLAAYKFIMLLFEYAVAFTAGLLLILTASWFFKIKRKGVLVILTNSFAGALIFIIASLFFNNDITHTGLFICGMLGLPGSVISFVF